MARFGYPSEAVTCCAGHAAELAAQVDAAGGAEPDHLHAGIRARVPRLEVSLAPANGGHVSTRLAFNPTKDSTQVHALPEDGDRIDAAVHARIPGQQPTGARVK